MLTNNREDYLEIIFHLESQGKTATTQAIAEHLNISSASVSENIKKLTAKKLLTYSPYKGVKLNPRGKKIALDIVRRHRLSERFLVDKLGVNWAEVHGEAHKLEHGISKLVGNKLYQMLGKPKTCPHGNPVPGLNGKISEEPSRPLSTFKINDQVRIVKITDEEPRLLGYLATLGLMPRITVTIEEKAKFNGPIMIKIGKSIYALGRRIADSIWAKKI